MSKDIKQIEEAVDAARKLYEAGASREDIKIAIFDLMSIKPDDYKNLFSNIDDALSYNGHYWKHNNKSKFFSDSFTFDKYVHEVCFKAIERLHPSTSVVARRSIKQLVEPHCNNKYILKLDIRKYYENINYADIGSSLEISGIDKELVGYIKQFYFTEGKSLRRGLRASPILSEYIGLKIDNFISKILHELNCKDTPYTRFYDDIIISSNEREFLRAIEKRIAEELGSLGLTVNKRKTRIQPTHTASILGLRLHNGCFTVPKVFKKKLRARIRHLEVYLSELHRYGGWDNSDDVYEAKVKAGTVIGSLWYIINNSNNDTTRYYLLLDQYYATLTSCAERLDYLLGNSDIIEYSE